MTSPQTAPAVPASSTPGILGRLGSWSVVHRRRVFLAWIALIIALGCYAPNVEKALSGAGWQADGSQSVAARTLAQKYFHGNDSAAIQVVISSTHPLSTPAGVATVVKVERLLRATPDIASVVPPVPGVTRNANDTTAVVLGGAGASTNQMVRVADAVKGPLESLSSPGISVRATGSSVLWSDFNAANHSAMMKSEMFSWPVTLAILILAFGSLVAAGLPLLLTMAGLLSAAGMLDLLTKLTPISVWAMNFAMMFALALGIDYALFIVVRFRGAHFGRNRETKYSVAETMDTAGKAVLFSGLTVLISLSSVMVVPSPAFKSMAGGIMLAVAFVLCASLTLLPAVLGALGDKVNNVSLPWVHSGEHRSKRFAAWGELLWNHPWAFGLSSLVLLLALAAPVIGLKTAMPSIKVVPATSSSRAGYDAVQKAFGVGAPGALQVLVPEASEEKALQVLQSSSYIAGVSPAQVNSSAKLVLISAIPTVDPSSSIIGNAIVSLRHRLPHGSLVGGAAAENYDLQEALAAKTPVVIGMVLALGFLVLLVALRALLLSFMGAVTSLLATAGAFGVSRLIFQNGDLHTLIHFTPQGFLDAWGPVFFFAMIFAISMDYTVFLLSSAKEHYERTGDPKDAMVNGLAHSGRVIFSAAAVMVAVFFTFSLSGPLPPKEMGIILGVAVLLDAFLVRLVLLPVLLRLTGQAAWWLPRWLDRVLPKVSFAHGE